MNDAISFITFGWFIKHAIVGIAAGYFLRVTEHLIWSTKVKAEENPLGNLGFSLIIIPQTIVFSLAFGYILVAITALYFKNIDMVDTAAYLITGFLAFVADDIRGLIRRACPGM